MIRRVFGGIIALLGLLLVADAANELWVALGGGFDYTGFAARLIALFGFGYAGPISVVAVGFMGGLLFAGGCVLSTPRRK